MRAVSVTPRHVMFTVCGRCPSLHAEGLKEECRLWLTEDVVLRKTFRPKQEVTRFRRNCLMRNFVV